MAFGGGGGGGLGAGGGGAVGEGRGTSRNVALLTESSIFVFIEKAFPMDGPMDLRTNGRTDPPYRDVRTLLRKVEANYS